MQQLENTGLVRDYAVRRVCRQCMRQIQSFKPCMITTSSTAISLRAFLEGGIGIEGCRTRDPCRLTEPACGAMGASKLAVWKTCNGFERRFRRVIGGSTKRASSL